MMHSHRKKEGERDERKKGRVSITFMRYCGDGLGHSTTPAATNFFKQDWYPQDQNCKQQQDNMNVNEVDQPQGDDDGVDQDEGLGSLRDPSCNMDKQDKGQSSDNKVSDKDKEEEEDENDEESDRDESKTEQLGFSEL
jgi:hypothetical protein